MPFGIPNTDGGSGGEYLGRIQYDARSGFFKTVKRVQGPDGYGNEEGQPSPTTQFAVDFGTLEVGYSKIASPPVFMVAPYGQPVPAQPEEMGAPDPKTGKVTKAFKPCFRLKVCSPATFGDGDAYYFSSNSKGVLNAVDSLYQQFLTASEAAAGKVPVVRVAKSTAIKTTGKHGTSTNYAPDFTIVQWIDRTEAMGERTVAVPGASTPRAASPAAAPSPSPSRHVPPPTRQPEPVGAGADYNNDVPF